jgi:uncharacterized membrane protein YedE/YeeE
MTAVAPSSAQTSGFVKEYTEAHPGNPMKTWLVFEMLGVLVGGFLSGAFAGRLKFKVEHSPKITSKRRLIFAGVGGLLFGFGAELGSSFTRGIHLNDGDIRNRIRPGLFC